MFFTNFQTSKKKNKQKQHFGSKELLAEFLFEVFTILRSLWMTPGAKPYDIDLAWGIAMMWRRHNDVVVYVNKKPGRLKWLKNDVAVVDFFFVGGGLGDVTVTCNFTRSLLDGKLLEKTCNTSKRYWGWDMRESDTFCNNNNNNNDWFGKV